MTEPTDGMTSWKSTKTVLAGKMHFCGPDQLHGFEERLTTDIYPADFGWTPDWSRFEHRPSWYHSMDSVTQAGPCVRTNQIDFDDETVYSARQKLFDIARGRDGRPFAMVVSMTHPHDPYTVPTDYWARYEGVDIDLPRVSLAPEELDPHSVRLRHVVGLATTPITPAQVLAARRAYYGAVSYVDDQVGLLLRTLRESGMADNTVVVLLADHGDMLGERGLWYKMTFFEPACRIPLIVHAPGRVAPGRSAAAASLVDVLPTLAELAGIEAGRLDGDLDGHSLVPRFHGAPGHDEVVGEYLAEGAVAPVVMIRRGATKFIHCPVDPDQYYDLRQDPDERRNLAGDPAVAREIEALRAEVRRRWDLEALDRAVRQSQARRHRVYAALREGRYTPWDHQPVRDASRAYIRNDQDLADLEAMARFPRVT
jgi:choline-sulfatase